MRQHKRKRRCMHTHAPTYAHISSDESVDRLTTTTRDANAREGAHTYIDSRTDISPIILVDTFALAETREQ